MNRFHLILAVLLTCLGGAFAQSPDDQYLPIYTLIQEGDAAAERDQKAQALAKYMEARSALQRFQKGFPEWSTDVVKFRLNYVGSRIASLSAQTQPQSAPQPEPPAEKPMPAEVEAQLSRVAEQVRQLQADKGLLEAKLKEALAATPAAVDPRELGKAEERIKNLQKENELLTASLEAAKSQAAPAGNTNAIANNQQALEEIKGLLAAEREQAATLAQEKEALQNRLKTLNADSAIAALRSENELLKKQAADLSAASKPGVSPEDIEALRKQLAALQSDKEVLRLEKEALQSRLKTVEASSATPPGDAAVRAENQSLRKQLAELRTTPDGMVTELRKANAELAALRADRDTWASEKAALEKQIAERSNLPANAKVSKADTRLVKDLEKERNHLRKKLDAATAQLEARKGKAGAARVREMETEVAALRARLQVMESARVPFSPEELAVMASTGPVLADTSSAPPQSDLSPAATTLIAEARRDFSARNFEKAEAKYEEALKSSGGKNAPALADLATIQMERGKLDDAERTIKEALTVTPDNAYSLSVLGQIQFRRGRYDDALDALSRAAVQDPKSPEIQNFLGVTLGQKGMRTQAETALRKALQLQPGFGQAHNNLAVIYAAQQPPLLELARWHYQKALAGGLPANPDLEKMLQAGGGPAR